MDARTDYQPRTLRVALRSRGGEAAALDFGPEDRPIDVVFSHANGFNARTYRTVLAPLAGELRILAMDLRGHGESTLPAVIEGRDGWAEFRDDLLAFVEKMTDRPVVLAGHSMGGTASLLVAAKAAERVKALALFDPVIMPTELVGHPERQQDSPLVQGALRRRAIFPSKAAALEAYIGRGAFKSWSAAQIADYVEGGFRATDNGEVALACTPEWEASNFRTHNYDPWTAFAESRCPIDILRAEIASTCRIDGREGELAATGRIRIRTVPGTSHFLPMERPEAVAEALRAAAA
jgi:pimeloyl-ACP methyl ester carboxylesterase